MATLVNTSHRNVEDMNTPMWVLNMIHMANIFNGKLMMVPITVSLIASRHAALFLNINHCKNFSQQCQVFYRSASMMYNVFGSFVPSALYVACVRVRMVCTGALSECE